jgi:uncharacterized membrane protein YgcG
MRSTDEAIEVLLELAAVPVTAVPDAQLRAEILDLVRAANLVQTALWRRIGSFERRGLAEADGFRSTRSWLSAFGRMSPHAATGACQRAAVVDQLSALTVAAQRGEVSGEHLGKVVALVEDIGIGPVQAADQVLAELVGSARPADIGLACDRVRAYVNPDGAEPDPEAILQRRGLTLARSGDMVRLRGQLDPEAGAVVMTALDALMTPPSAHDERTAAQRRADALTELARLPLHQTTLPIVGGARPQLGLLITPQALLRQSPRPGTDPIPDWITRLANHTPQPGPQPRPDPQSGCGRRDNSSGNGGSGGSGGKDNDGGGGGSHDRGGGAPGVDNQAANNAGPPPTVPHQPGPPEPGPHQPGPPEPPPRPSDDPFVAIGIPPAPEPAWLSWVGSIHTTTAQRLACDSVIYRVLYDPATGQPLDVGRTHRTAPPWIRKALHARDRGCRWPGCTAPTPWAGVSLVASMYASQTAPEAAAD